MIKNKSNIFAKFNFCFLTFLILLFSSLFFISCVGLKEMGSLGNGASSGMNAVMGGSSNVKLLHNGTFFNFQYRTFNMTIFVDNTDLKRKEYDDIMNSLVIFYLTPSFSDSNKCNDKYVVVFKFGKPYLCINTNYCKAIDLDFDYFYFMKKIINAVRTNINIDVNSNTKLNNSLFNLSQLNFAVRKIVAQTINNRILKQTNSKCDLSFLANIVNKNGFCYDVYERDFNKKVKINDVSVY